MSDERFFRTVRGEVKRFTRAEYESWGDFEETFEEWIAGISPDYYIDEVYILTAKEVIDLVNEAITFGKRVD